MMAPLTLIATPHPDAGRMYHGAALVFSTIDKETLADFLKVIKNAVQFRTQQILEGIDMPFIFQQPWND